MAATTRKHRVTEYTILNDQRDHLDLSLTQAKDRIRSARRHADTFHTYKFTTRDNTPMHVAYAHYQPNSPRHGFSKYGADVTRIYQLTEAAVFAAFGLSERDNTKP
ncbi:hypothetical protein ABZ404_36880 [Streptomyces sp. NPDC005878]|uniref:hypothetical protein n=1 Tax=Streptomyces sp. NPDC005878 TaxID=3157077 RepID=UPI0033D6C179